MDLCFEALETKLYTINTTYPWPTKGAKMRNDSDHIVVATVNDRTTYRGNTELAYGIMLIWIVC